MTMQSKTSADESAVDQLNTHMTRILNERAETRDWSSEYRDKVARGIADARGTVQFEGRDYDDFGDMVDIVEERDDEVLVCDPHLRKHIKDVTDALGNDDHVDSVVCGILIDYAGFVASDKDKFTSVNGVVDVFPLKRAE